MVLLREKLYIGLKTNKNFNFKSNNQDALKYKLSIKKFIKSKKPI